MVSNAREIYTFKVAPTYAIASCVNGNHSTILDEWTGRTAEEFNAGMAGRGFRYHTEEYDLSAGHYVEHVWSK